MNTRNIVLKYLRRVSITIRYCITVNFETTHIYACIVNAYGFVFDSRGHSE